jgi:hypothetical protein
VRDGATGAAIGWLIGALLCVALANWLARAARGRRERLLDDLPAWLVRFVAPTPSPRTYRVVGALIAVAAGVWLILLQT